MANGERVRPLYDQLMTINGEAFAMGLFSVAYHALASALHSALELQDEAALQRIADTANAQLAWIDRNAPKYEHSTSSARLRGHESIFDTLALQAAARVEMVYQRKQWFRTKGKV